MRGGPDRRLSVHQTDGRTDRQTDRQTDVSSDANLSVPCGPIRLKISG